MAIELVMSEVAAAILKNGVAKIVLTPPSNLKIQTTGDAGEVILNDGPSHGKTWIITVRVEVVET